MGDYPKPSLTSDAVVLAGTGPSMKLLVIERDRPPYAGSFALPGGFVDPFELPFNACLRELAEETGLELSAAEGVSLSVRARQGRDPRGWTVSQPFLFHLAEPTAVHGGDDARQALWVPLSELEQLAFDHGAMLCEALGRFWPWMPSVHPRLTGVLAYGQPDATPSAVTFFGGSFNPWHDGHQACVDLYPADAPLVLAPDVNPFKDAAPDDCAWQRCRGLQARAEAANVWLFPGFCGRETANPTIRWFPHVAVKHKALLIGDDSYADFPRWFQADRLVQTLDALYVAPRQASEAKRRDATAWFNEHRPELSIHHLDDHAYRHLSSTDIRRQRCGQGDPS